MEFRKAFFSILVSGLAVSTALSQRPARGDEARARPTPASAKQTKNAPKPVVMRYSDFGVEGDGIKDDTAALQRMFNHIPPKAAQVIIDLGSGVFKVSGSTTTDGYEKYTLAIGVGRRLPASLIIRGDGARFTINQKSSAHLLLISAGLDNLLVQGLTFERTEIAQVGDAGFFGGQGVYVTDSAATRKVDSIKFANCKFINCHRSITVISRFMTLTTTDLANPDYVSSGRLDNLVVDSCQMLYPYGSNSVNLDYGSQAFYSGNWSRFTTVKNSTFDGATTGDVSSVPNKLPKDGFVFGEPLRLVCQKNKLRHFAVEGIAHEGQVGVAYTSDSFVMPESTKSVPSAEVEVHMESGGALMTVGQRFYVIGAGYLIVKKVISDKLVKFSNRGAPGNAAAGTVIPKRLWVSLPKNFTESYGLIKNNNFDGTRVKGNPIYYLVGQPCVRINNQRALISDNTFVNTGQGVFLAMPESPYHPAAQKDFGSVVEGNTFRAMDGNVIYDNKPVIWVSMVMMFQGRGVTVADNDFTFSNNKNFKGIECWSQNVKITRNTLTAETSVTAVAGAQPSTGVYIGNIGQLSEKMAPYISGNTFTRLDTAIGTTSGQQNSMIITDTNKYIDVTIPVQRNPWAVMVTKTPKPPSGTSQ